MPVGFHDAADIGLHHGALQRTTRLGFNYRAKLFVLDLLVALESDAIEYRGFGEMHNQPLPGGTFDCHVLEHAGAQERFERCIARGLVEPAIGRRVEIRTHRLGIDAAIALHLDGLRRKRLARQKPQPRKNQTARGDRAPASPERRPVIPHRPACFFM